MATGHIIGGPVDVDYDGAVLTADLAVGDLVLEVDDGADFDEDAGVHGGQVIIGMELGADGDLDPATGTVLDYTTWDDDSSMVTLAAASTVAASSGDRVYIANPVSGLPVGELVVDVAIDGADTTGDALRATLDLALLDTVGDVDLDGLAVEVDTDEDDQLVVSKLLGLGRKMGRVRGYQDSHVATGPGDLTFHLTYRPLPDSTIHLYWNGDEQEDDAWSLDGWTLTISDPDGLVEADDRFYVKYLYTDPTLRPPVVGSVSLVGSQVLQNNLGLTSVDLPAGTQAGDILLLSITSGLLVGSMPSSSDPRMTTQNVDTGQHLFTAFGLEDGSGDPVTFSVSDTEYNGQILLAVYRPTGTVTHVESNGTTPFAPTMPAGVSAAVMVVAQASSSGAGGAFVSSPQGSWVQDRVGSRNSTLSSAWHSDSGAPDISVSPTGLVAWRAIVVGLGDE